VSASGGNLSIAGVNAGYGRNPVIRDVTLEPIAPGSIVGLIGPNAAGKSTLLRALAGLVSTEGRVLLGETDLLAMSASRRAEFVGFMPQAIPDGIELSVLDTVLCALRIGARARGEDAARLRAVEALRRVNALDLAMEPLNRLSGGQRQIVSLAQAIANNPPLLLLDEPTSALDLKHQFQVLETVRSLAASGVAVVMVLHDLALAAQWTSRCIVLKGGGIYADGVPGEVIDSAMLADVFGVTASLSHVGDRLHIRVSGLASHE
jgi:iron complex transport system ATP-binding protein